MRAHDFINEFAPGDGEDNGRKFIPWEDFVKHVANMVGDEFSVKMSKIPKQVKAVFTPHDVAKYGPTQIYAYWDRKGVAVHGGFQIGSYQKLDRLYTHYRLGKLGDSKYVDFTLPNVSRFADIIKSNTDGALQPELNEFLDDRKRDDDDEISKIVSTADRLLKQGYRVDLGVVGAMGQVVRADFSLTGFAPNGALAFKRKTKHYIRPFLIDDDDRYEFKMVGPKHYRIVDVWPEELNESTYQEHEEQLRDFVRWCVRKLKIKQQLPQIRFQDAKEGPDQHRTGYYDDNDDVMWIYTGNRNLIDIMRTVAHELTHRKQHEADMVRGDQSYPGSPMEQQADAVAGYLMKLYGKEHPEIIE